MLLERTLEVTIEQVDDSFGWSVSHERAENIEVTTSVYAARRGSPKAHSPPSWS